MSALDDIYYIFNISQLENYFIFVKKFRNYIGLVLIFVENFFEFLKKKENTNSEIKIAEKSNGRIKANYGEISLKPFRSK